MHINQETNFFGPYDYIDHLKKLSLDELLQTKIKKNIFSKDEYEVQKNFVFRDVFSKKINSENQTKFFNIYKKLCQELDYIYPVINFFEPKIKEYNNNHDILFKMFCKKILIELNKIKNQDEIKYNDIINQLSKNHRDIISEIIFNICERANKKVDDKNNVEDIDLGLNDLFASSYVDATPNIVLEDLSNGNVDSTQMSQKSNLKTYIIMAAAIAGLLTGVILAASGILIPLGIGAVQIALNCLVGVLSGATLGTISTIGLKP